MDEQEEIRRAVAEGRCIIIATPTRFKDFEPAAASIKMMSECCGEVVWVAPYQSIAAVKHGIPIHCLLCQLEWCFRWGRL